MNANHVEHYEYLKSLLGKLGKDLLGPMGGFAQLYQQFQEKDVAQYYKGDATSGVETG